MKIIQKLILVLFSLFVCQYQLTATSLTHFTTNLIDTIPQIEPEYKGNRILVKAIKVVKKKGKSYKIEYKIVNNGRNKIKLGKSNLIPKDLIVQFDKSLEENDLVGAKSSIVESIKKKSISLRPGQLILGNKLKFTYQPIPPSDRIANEIKKPEETIVENKEQKKEIPIKTEVKKETKEVPKSKFEEAVKDIVEEVPLPNTEINKLESPRYPSKSTAQMEERKTQEIPLDETVLVKPKEKENSEKLAIKDTESILDGFPKKDQKEDRKEEIEEIKTKEVEKIELIDSSANNQIVEEELENQISKEKLCADLIIQNVEILKKNKRIVLVKYTIKNVGNIPISLHGETKKEIDNIAIQSHFTRSHKLTRGSIPVDIAFVKKRTKDVKGMLDPEESISQKLKIEISKVTKFTPVLALTINPISTNVECNRLNNIFFIDLIDQEEKASKTIKSIPQQPIEKSTNEKVTTLEN
ncbi:MAG: hypothetical protein AB8H03_04100 [Saprospiraceae bacterium]